MFAIICYQHRFCVSPGQRNHVIFCVVFLEKLSYFCNCDTYISIIAVYWVLKQCTQLVDVKGEAYALETCNRFCRGQDKKSCIKIVEIEKSVYQIRYK